MCNIKLWLFYYYSIINKYTYMEARIRMEQRRKDLIGKVEVLQMHFPFFLPYKNVSVVEMVSADFP